MRRPNLIAFILLLLLIPVAIMAFVPFVHDIRRNAIIKQGNEIISRIDWYHREYQRLPEDLRQAAVPPEDRGPEVHYTIHSPTHFTLSLPVGASDSVTYHSPTRSWQ